MFSAFGLRVLRGISKETWWAERPWDQLHVEHILLHCFSLCSLPRSPLPLGLAAHGSEATAEGVEVRHPPPPRRPKEAFLTARSPWDAEWKLPGRSISQKVANGGVPVRVKDAAVARQRLLFPLGVWL